MISILAEFYDCNIRSNINSTTMTYLLDVMCIVKIQSVTTGTRSTTGCLQTTRRMTAVINESCPPPLTTTIHLTSPSPHL